jgi:hypothetical protein
MTTPTPKFLGHCNTFADFNVAIDNFVEKSAILNQPTAKTLVAFLEANHDYLISGNIQSDKYLKINDLVEKASAAVEKNSPQYATLQNIKALHLHIKSTIPSTTKTYTNSLYEFSDSHLGGDESIKQAIKNLMHDRFTGEKKLTDFLKTFLGQLPEVNDSLVQKDPLLALFTLILNNNPAEDHLREAAADAYVAKNPEDARFEKAYAYLKDPHILLAHLLIISNQWRCVNPENKSFYDEQMAGSFHGNIAFDKGDRITSEEFALIRKQEGENPRFPISSKLEQKEGYYEVKDWCATPNMVSTENRLDDLFIASRRAVQERTLDDFILRLKETSALVQKVYALPPNESTVVAIIGPYGAGKSLYVQQKFAKEKPITVYSLDKLNDILKKPTSRPQDHHFEAMMMTSKLLKGLADVPALLTETAAIDEFRFNRMVNRDFSSRNRIIVEEIAPENTQDAVGRFVAREGAVVSSNQTRMGAVQTSVEDALKFRDSRIENAKNNAKIQYTLYSSLTNNGTAVFAEIAKTLNGKVIIAEGKEEIYSKLTKKQ